MVSETAFLEYIRVFKCISCKQAHTIGVKDVSALVCKLNEAGYQIKPCYLGGKLIGFRYANPKKARW